MDGNTENLSENWSSPKGEDIRFTTVAETADISVMKSQNWDSSMKRTTFSEECSTGAYWYVVIDLGDSFMVISRKPITWTNADLLHIAPSKIPSSEIKI